MTAIRGVIWDVDGTLVDSNDAHAAAWTEAFANRGYEVPYEDVRRLIGMGSDKLLMNLVSVEKDSAEGQNLSSVWKGIFTAKYLPKLTAFPDVEALLRHMHDASLRMAVASSSEKEMLTKLLDIACATDYMESSTSADDAEQSKPAPDIVQAALAQLDLDPSEVVMVGDTPYDIEAATRAGIRIIAVRCGGWDDPVLKGAIAIYDSPADLLQNFDDSPLGPGPVGG